MHAQAARLSSRWPSPHLLRTLPAPPAAAPLQLPFSVFLPVQLASMMVMLTLLPGPCQALAPLLGSAPGELARAAGRTRIDPCHYAACSRSCAALCRARRSAVPPLHCVPACAAEL